MGALAKFRALPKLLPWAHALLALASVVNLGFAVVYGGVGSRWLVLSVVGAGVCVIVMVGHYVRMARRQAELIEEIERQQDRANKLAAARDEAERANGAKSEFLAKMSHELRTPLNAVLGYSEMLLQDAELDGHGQQIADLQRISAAGKQLLAMANDILDISRIETGKMALHLADVDLNTLIDQLEATARPLAAQNANVLVVERGASLGTVHLDAGKLRQAIFNLLSNATKFTRNGRVTLSVRREGDGIEVAVADTGIGISREQQRVLFSRFTRMGASHGGAGLGLALSQNLCRLMGGGISVESELGKGSRFVIRLPIRVAQATPEETLPAVMHRGPSADEQAFLDEIDAETSVPSVALADAVVIDDTRERLLVVDDDRNFLELAERLFLKEGYVPICTDAPQSALQIARTVRPTAIFLDILMPGFDGWDVLAALKSDPATAAIPVFMISILSERTRALAAGADGVVMKPLDAARVKAAITGLKAARGGGGKRSEINRR
ncbi:MAG: response regulator [Devosia sp.]|uniref:ATP-binding response regulator n=1 Tax=Devosia sp. TaxID=1871048 RepID=UPI002617803F|nr:ATP-binding protein [Devosia sp.]MDB5527584.1 response regulator [Devosia sp.]